MAEDVTPIEWAVTTNSKNIHVATFETQGRQFLGVCIAEQIGIAVPLEMVAELAELMVEVAEGGVEVRS